MPPPSATSSCIGYWAFKRWNCQSIRSGPKLHWRVSGLPLGVNLRLSSIVYYEALIQRYTHLIFQQAHSTNLRRRVKVHVGRRAF